MKAFAGFISTTLLLTSLSTLAHEGHDHMPVTMKKAVEIAGDNLAGGCSIFAKYEPDETVQDMVQS